MTGNLVVAIIVITGFALSAVFALKTMDSSDTTGADSGTPQSQVQSAETEALRLGVAAGCQNSGGPSSACGCIADQLIAAGYDTVAEMQRLGPAIAAAAGSGNTSAVPADVMAIRDRCL